MISNMGVPGFVLVLDFIFFIIGLFILYMVISTAVKVGINKSVVGQFIEKSYGVKNDKISLPDDK